MTGRTRIATGATTHTLGCVDVELNGHNGSERDGVGDEGEKRPESQVKVETADRAGWIGPDRRGEPFGRRSDATDVREAPLAHLQPGQFVVRGGVLRIERQDTAECLGRLIAAAGGCSGAAQREVRIWLFGGNRHGMQCAAFTAPPLLGFATAKASR